ncbi:MAG TPA: hypothetical protein DEP72_00115 [Clostridiales bacterium]|nr:MAG: hypothetical protein A2Y18_08345 [Clostridiales bacterium GWD2_32_19]HCC06556.1 hypothetical protein [Clostridiales bacterium]
MIFRYRAQTYEGNIVNGTLDAESASAVRNILLQRKFIIKSIKEVKETSSFDMFIKKVNKKEMIFVFKNFSTMLRAGIPIIQAVEMMQDQVKQPEFRKALKKMRIDLSKGLLLSQSILETRMFPTLVTAIIRIGEETGGLDKSFLQLSSFFLKQDKTTGKIFGAMLYPIVTMVAAIIAMWYLTTGILPTILNVLPNKEDVGWTTKALMMVSDVMGKHQTFIGITILLLIFVVPWLSTTVFRNQKDYIILKIPGFGDIIRKTKAVQFTTTLAILAEAGINITDALDIIIQVIGNEAFRDNIREVKGGVMKGETISKNLSPKLFDKLVITIVSIGESTGDMQNPLRDIAEFLDDEVDRTINNMITLITPLSIVFMAGIVTIIVFGVIGPMYSMYGSIQ